MQQCLCRWCFGAGAAVLVLRCWDCGARMLGLMNAGGGCQARCRHEYHRLVAVVRSCMLMLYDCSPLPVMMYVFICDVVSNMINNLAIAWRKLGGSVSCLTGLVALFSTGKAYMTGYSGNQV